MIIAIDLLDAIKEELIYIKKILFQDIVACVLDHINKSYRNSDL